MRTINHFEKNRPVHLALRDVYYERAAELLQEASQMHGMPMEISRFEEMLFLLRTARQHGAFAVRSEMNNGRDCQFRDFINMLAGNIKSVLSMLNLKQSVETEGGFFFSFLGANHASVALQAEEYERRARDIVRCVQNTLTLARSAYEGLKQANGEAFSQFERERYEKAAEYHRKRVGQRFELPEYRKVCGRYD